MLFFFPYGDAAPPISPIPLACFTEFLMLDSVEFSHFQYDSLPFPVNKHVTCGL